MSQVLEEISPVEEELRNSQVEEERKSIDSSHSFSTISTHSSVSAILKQLGTGMYDALVDFRYVFFFSLRISLTLQFFITNTNFVSSSLILFENSRTM